MEGCKDEEEDVVRVDGASYDHTTGWEYNTPGLNPELPSLRLLLLEGNLPTFKYRARKVAADGGGAVMP